LIIIDRSATRYADLRSILAQQQKGKGMTLTTHEDYFATVSPDVRPLLEHI